MHCDLLIKNVIGRRSDLSEVDGYIPSLWGLLIKHFIPTVLLILFFLGADGISTDGEGNAVKVFGHYGGYATKPFQVLVLTVVFAGFLFGSSVVFPKMYGMLQKQKSIMIIHPSILKIPPLK